MTRLLRTLLLAAAALIAFAAAPSAASAGSKQFSIFEDDAVLLGLTDKDPDKAMAEVKYLGGDVVRVFVVWSRVSPQKKSRTVPAGFDPANPNDPQYDWAIYDRFVALARKHDLKVMLTLSGEIPFWASREPDRCPHHLGGYDNLALSCMWKPDRNLFEQFSQAVATRYKGLVEYYSLWNEPNLEHYLYPQFSRSKRGTVDLGGKQLRELWSSGYRGLTRMDPAVKDKVLFGETAAISSPVDTLYAAMCLDEDGKPFRGWKKKAQGCSKPSKLPIGGLAVHPYNKDAVGTVFTRSFTEDSMAMAYTNRATRVLRQGEKYGRIPRGRGVYITEFGFQSKPPDKKGLSLNGQAKAMNESDRLFFGDRRIRAVAQFELYDVPELKDEDVYNTGLRTLAGQLKPSWGAYRMPLVVTRLSADQVEVWGQVRPSNVRTQVALFAARKGGRFARIGSPRTNASGYFKVRVRRGQAARLRYRTTWASPNGETFPSRTAAAGKKIGYLKFKAKKKKTKR
ncbi:MAG TPA: hypothetical protein VEX39_09245 [Thermoleophilaceae bacterium]|nr:hypothetical protein [Thermoleophilaceae bacterium]